METRTVNIEDSFVLLLLFDLSLVNRQSIMFGTLSFPYYLQRLHQPQILHIAGLLLTGLSSQDLNMRVEILFFLLFLVGPGSSVPVFLNSTMLLAPSQEVQALLEGGC